MDYQGINHIQDPDNFDHTAYLKLKNTRTEGAKEQGNKEQFINLGIPNDKSCSLVLEDTPKTLWTLSPRTQTNKMTIFTIVIKDRSREIFSLDIFNPSNPRLMAWKMNARDNQIFRWSLENKNYIISHILTPNNIGLNNLPSLVIETVDPDMIPIEGYMQLHNSSFKNLYINLDSNGERYRELKIEPTPDVNGKWKIIFLDRLYNKADPKQKYKVKITNEEYCLDIYSQKEPQLKGWRSNNHSNQVFILERMDDLFLIHHSVNTTNIGLNKFPELFLKFEQ